MLGCGSPPPGGCRPELVVESPEYLGEGVFCRACSLNLHLVVRIPKNEEAAQVLALPLDAGAVAIPPTSSYYCPERAPCPQDDHDH
jgi:hypothetical protein